ncbi:hypothetical protein [Paraclostridium bifermentans]|uniref:hypothetical protein n=1 Tax=Paraclostridium bifermentans TaxID=1490 RepID=UPI00290B8018|nr:hypothetical protein [Paraclostridium bifermentans]MDU3803798.1 hypothetical protein [Paraclostridium bifermentans]
MDLFLGSTFKNPDILRYPKLSEPMKFAISFKVIDEPISSDFDVFIPKQQGDVTIGEATL